MTRMVASLSVVVGCVVSFVAPLADACNTGSWHGFSSNEVSARPACKGSAGEVFVLEVACGFGSAEMMCKEAGGTLASIHSAVENAKVSEACGDTVDRKCWIGLSATRTPEGGKEGPDWEWSDGSVLDYTNWAAGEPNNIEGSIGHVAFMNFCGEPVRKLQDSSSSFEYEEPSQEEEDDELPVEAYLVIALWLLFNVVLPVGCLFGAIGAFCYAYSTRQTMLDEARKGKRVEPPSPCWKYCCGFAAIYYWEGCSSNYLITCLCWPWFAVCCWNPTPSPKEGGNLVGGAVGVATRK